MTVFEFLIECNLMLFVRVFKFDLQFLRDTIGSSYKVFKNIIFSNSKSVGGAATKRPT